MYCGKARVEDLERGSQSGLFQYMQENCKLRPRKDATPKSWTQTTLHSRPLKCIGRQLDHITSLKCPLGAHEQGKKVEARADSFESTVAGLAAGQLKVRMAADQLSSTSKSTTDALEALSSEVRALRREQKKSQVR